jgi:coproporphyrinogen III oxidase-like Fe-S oxidoreductase
MNIRDIIHGIDIMAGIPGSTEEELQSDLQRVISLHPEHISVYLLTLEKDTPLWMRVKNDDEFQNLQCGQLLFAMDYLQSAGYRQYEISNYCIPGFESRHNLKYWKFLPYLGFGAAAHGFTGSMRYYNNQNVSEYIANPQYIEDVRSHKAAMAEFIMTGLLFECGIPSSVKRALEQLITEELIVSDYTNGSVRYALSREGIFISDYVIYRCVESLL